MTFLLSSSSLVRPAKSFLRAAFAMLFVSSFLSVATAQTYQRIKTFSAGSATGVNPQSSLIAGSDGRLYGAAISGGNSNLGTIFVFNKDGSGFQKLHDFAGGVADGSQPTSALMEGQDGGLYGTASAGGSNNFGIIFRINKDGSGYSILKHFVNSVVEGASPVGGLAQGGDGVLYGTAYAGTVSGGGTVFRLNTNGTAFMTIHPFSSGIADGGTPQSSLVFGHDGQLYGVTFYGGTNSTGVVFRMNTNGSVFNLLQSFSSSAGDASYPNAIIQNSDGVLFGTTSYSGGLNGYGTVFKINTNGLGFSILRSFNGPGTDGIFLTAEVIFGTNGILYGTTYTDQLNGYGTVFKIDTGGGNYSIVHYFTGDPDGRTPYGGMVRTSDGAIYGTTYFGGSSGAGTIFRLADFPLPVNFTDIQRAGTNVALTLAGLPNQAFRIQSNTNLNNTNGWQDVATKNTGASGSLQFNNPVTLASPGQLFRTVTP